MKKILLLLLVANALLSCSKPHKTKVVERAFYYWKNNSWSPTNIEDSLVQNLGVKKLYVKLFEVERDKTLGNIPVAKTQLHLYNAYDSINLVPTVYLRNEVFKNISKPGLDSLADNVNFLINKITTDTEYSRGLNRMKNISEYQMDCDWTPSTRDNYFYFLKKIKKYSGKQISCTLRLYPYKYPDKMGVPPVDKAMLMCYNLINPLEDKNSNSILDAGELDSYLDSSEKYPLHLDIALPVYSWVQLYQNNRFVAILYSPVDKASGFRSVKPLWYEALQDTVIDDRFIRKGDMLKFEDVTTQKINEAISIIKQNIEFDKHTTISFFHLDGNQLKNYSHEEVSGFYNSFSK